MRKKAPPIAAFYKFMMMLVYHVPHSKINLMKPAPLFSAGNV